MKRKVFLVLALFAWCLSVFAGDGWWPEQKAPKSVSTCKIARVSDIREMNLAQSVSGLAAQAVNEGIFSEAVWISTPNPDYAIYYASLMKRLGAKKAGEYKVWELVKRYAQKGIVKGYVLYDAAKQDNSINLATVYAGLQKGVLVDISQEAAAEKLGLKKLADATGREPDTTIFNELKNQLNPGLLVLANPKFSNNRDYAIAHKSMVYYGVDSVFYTILKWVHPVSPVIGWNKGDEFRQIEPCTRYGLINTATDWCMNLALLTIPSTQEPVKLKSIDPAKIDWAKKGNFHSFLLSDGDNMQWTFGGFLNNKEYWGNDYRDRLPMSFTSCVLNLSQAGRDVYNYLASTQTGLTSVVEYGGGYYYPDLFAKSTDTPEKLLRDYAKKINVQMKQTGTKVFGFICRNMSGEAAMKAYRIYAEEIEDLTGMIAVQYSPYNGGRGKVFWVKNKKGVEIPVVTARYQLWANLPKPGSGNPAALANWINTDSTLSGDSKLDWTIVHAWSEFADPSSGKADPAKGVKDDTARRGVPAVWWTKERINENTTIVSLEELLWRIRMKHDPEATKRVMEAGGR